MPFHPPFPHLLQANRAVCLPFAGFPATPDTKIKRPVSFLKSFISFGNWHSRVPGEVFFHPLNFQSTANSPCLALNNVYIWGIWGPSLISEKLDALLLGYLTFAFNLINKFPYLFSFFVFLPFYFSSWFRRPIWPVSITASPRKKSLSYVSGQIESLTSPTRPEFWKIAGHTGLSKNPVEIFPGGTRIEARK